MPRNWSNQSLSFPPLPPLRLQSTKKTSLIQSRWSPSMQIQIWTLFTEHLHFQKIFLTHSTSKQVLNSSIHNSRNVLVSQGLNILCLCLVFGFFLQYPQSLYRKRSVFQTPCKDEKTNHLHISSETFLNILHKITVCSQSRKSTPTVKLFFSQAYCWGTEHISTLVAYPVSS